MHVYSTTYFISFRMRINSGLLLRSNIDLRPRIKTPQKQPQRITLHRYASRGRAVSWPRDVDEHRAPPAGDAGPCVVIKRDNQIIEMILPHEPIPRGSGRSPDMPVIVPVGRVLAPGVLRTDAEHRQQSPWPQPAIGAPPQAFETKPPGGRRAVPFALVGLDTTAPERNGNAECSSGEPAAGAAPRRRAHPNQAERRRPHRLVPLSPHPANPPSILLRRLLFYPRMLYSAIMPAVP